MTRKFISIHIVKDDHTWPFLAINSSKLNMIISSIVVESDGGTTPLDGPDGPSIIGSVDKVFEAVKNYDQYKCIERML